MKRSGKRTRTKPPELPTPVGSFEVALCEDHGDLMSAAFASLLPVVPQGERPRSFDLPFGAPRKMINLQASRFVWPFHATVHDESPENCALAGCVPVPEGEA